MNGKVAKIACIHDTKADRIIGNKKNCNWYYKH